MVQKLFFGKFKEPEGPWHYGIFYQGHPKYVTHICSSKKACSVYHNTPHNLTINDIEFAAIDYHYEPHVKQDIIFEYRCRIQEAITGRFIPFLLSKILGELRTVAKIG